MFRYLDNVEDTAGGRLYQYNEDDFRFKFYQALKKHEYTLT